MSITNVLMERIDAIDPGTIFTYNDLKISSENRALIIATLGRLAAKGIIRRFAKGKYYKPKQGLFGEVSLMESQMLESFLKENGNWVGYVTGARAYNSIGLNAHISKEYVIATAKLRRPFERDRFKARFVKSYCLIEEKYVRLLRFLDAVKDFNKIIGTSINRAVKFFKIKLKRLSRIEINKLIQFAMNYPPYTRALLGAMIELTSNSKMAIKLYKSLNTKSSYKLNIGPELLPNRTKWRIR